MSQIEAIIFDCDGVMFESRRANLAYYNRILAEFSYPLVTADQTDRANLCHTASSPVVLAKLMSQEDLSPALDFAANIDYCEFIPHMVPESNLLDLLRRLSGDYPLAIATNRGKSIVSILDHFKLQDFFDVVVNSLDVERPKPAPDMLFLAVEKLKKTPDKCLFIGDSELDRLAATEAKVPFAAYGGGVTGDISFSSHLELFDYL